MPNGKPGDHPLTDLLRHGLPAFTPRIDEQLREVAILLEQQAWAELHEVVNKHLGRSEQDLEEIERDLAALRKRLLAARKSPR